MIKAQVKVLQESAPTYDIHPPASHNGYHPAAQSSELYPNLHEFMGLELTPELQKQLQQMSSNNMAVVQAQPMTVAVPSASSASPYGLIAPLSGQSAGLARAQVTHGIREVVLCKGADNKIGLRCQAISKGIFVSLVQSGSPAALVGLRFGDQILQINGTSVAGWSMDKIHDAFKKADVNNIRVAVRDRPFERTITLHKDSFGHVGFAFKNGAIVSLVKDSSAARNGLLTDHNLLEVNGQNVVGLKDKEVTRIIDGAGSCITVTVMPTFLYEHMIKNMSSSLLKKSMDHSIPDL